MNNDNSIAIEFESLKSGMEIYGIINRLKQIRILSVICYSYAINKKIEGFKKKITDIYNNLFMVDKIIQINRPFKERLHELKYNGQNLNAMMSFLIINIKEVIQNIKYTTIKALINDILDQKQITLAKGSEEKLRQELSTMEDEMEQINTPYSGIVRRSISSSSGSKRANFLGVELPKHETGGFRKLSHKKSVRKIKKNVSCIRKH